MWAMTESTQFGVKKAFKYLKNSPKELAYGLRMARAFDLGPSARTMSGRTTLSPTERTMADL